VRSATRRHELLWAGESGTPVSAWQTLLFSKQGLVRDAQDSAEAKDGFQRTQAPALRAATMPPPWIEPKDEEHEQRNPYSQHG